MGLYLESLRTKKIVDSYKNYEVEALDLKLQNYYYQIMDKTSCEAAIKQNFNFADNIYNRGLELERYEEANQVTDDLYREKKRYVLLKTELWLNSILLKKKCNNPFDTIVYIYSGDPGNSAEVAKQKVISNVLKTVKEHKGDKIILLPIAGDLKLGIVDLQLRVYNITKIPSIIINEKTILEGFQSSDEIESYLTRFYTITNNKNPLI